MSGALGWLQPWEIGQFWREKMKISTRWSKLYSLQINQLLMPEERERSRRLLYGGIAACFFIVGLVLMVFLFWLVFPVIIGLGLWVFAALFLSLAIKGRTFTDWNAEKIARRERAKRKDLI